VLCHPALSYALLFLLGAGATDSYSLTTTARRLGCALAAINDPRRNLAATWEEDADFPDGGRVPGSAW
jgi:hypothetical protein